MDSEAILKRFDRLGMWRSGDQRAPHKPLLILYALGRWRRGNAEIAYGEAESDLTSLLREFGPPRRSDHPEQPFWRLRKDGIWTVQVPEGLSIVTSDDNPSVTLLRAHNIRAGFSKEVQSALCASPGLIPAIAGRILERHFPESLHQDILNAVGLTLESTGAGSKRDPAFRQRVLKAYEYRCAVCGFDVRLGSVSIALDAAHIRWHQAGGPDTESNGLALCVLHHKTFDLGAFTLRDGVLLVSDQANGTAGFQETLLAYHGRPIRDPQHPGWRPARKHLDWHVREVFKGEARYAEAPTA